jgi:hypothetical protein
MARAMWSNGKLLAPSLQTEVVETTIMKRLEFSGLSGLFLMVALGLALLAVVLGLPAMAIASLWNMAVAAEGGPSLTVFQGLVLWLIVLCGLGLIIRPEIHIQVGDQDDLPAEFRDQDASLPSDTDEDRPTPEDTSRFSEHWHQWRKQHGLEKK